MLIYQIVAHIWLYGTGSIFLEHLPGQIARTARARHFSSETIWGTGQRSGFYIPNMNNFVSFDGQWQFLHFGWSFFRIHHFIHSAACKHPPSPAGHLVSFWPTKGPSTETSPPPADQPRKLASYGRTSRWWRPLQVKPGSSWPTVQTTKTQLRVPVCISTENNI